MPLVNEFFNQGWVNARDAILLKPGELQQTDECCYRIFDPTLYSAPGRSQYNTTIINDSSSTPTAVKGLSHLPFDDHTDQLLATGGTLLYGGDFVAADGSATLAVITGPGQVADAVVSNTTTITSASSGFANMVQGARVIGANIPNNTFVQTVSSATSIILTQACTAGSPTTEVVTFDMGIAASYSNVGSEILDTVQWGNAYFGLVGTNTYVQRLYWKARSLPSPSLTDLFISRPAGLDPVTTQPTVVVNTGAGHSWSAVLGNGFYWFLITEAFSPDQPDEVESAYVAVNDKKESVGPVAAQITSFATQDITITRPSQRNDGSNGRLSTHWYVYMSPLQTDGSDVPSIALFRRVATVPISSTNIILRDINSRQSNKTPAAQTSVAGRNQFNNPGNMTGPADNLFATGGSASGMSVPAVPMQQLFNFGFSGTTDDQGSTISGATVTGVGIAVKGAGGANGLMKCGFNIYLQTSTKTTGPIWGVMGGNNQAYVRFGDQFDTMGVNWVPSDFVNGTFFARIEVAGAAQKQTLFIDTVEVTVFYSGTSVNLNGRPYRVITYRSQVGTTVDDPANLPPPVGANTGDIFQGSVVLNDPSDPASIVYSLPGYPESFPKPYRLKLNTRKKDIIRCIRRVGQVLVVLLQSNVKRVNYLPSEIDTDFSEGLAHEDIATDHGCVGPLAAVSFTMPGSQYQAMMAPGVGYATLAYVALNGLRATDGVHSRFLNIDLKLNTFIDMANISKCQLRVYPREKWLVLYFPPLGGDGTCTKAIIYSYSEDKIKEGGMLPAIGPVSVSARSSCEATLNGLTYLLTGHQFGGKIYVEDVGDTIPNGYTLDGVTQVIGASVVRTRLFYPSGPDRSAREERIYLRCSPRGTIATTAASTLTAGSTTITSSAAFGSVLPGMLVSSPSSNLPGDTIVVSVTNSSTIIVSQPASASLTETLSFDSGTIAISPRGSNIGEAVEDTDTGYTSMRIGGLVVVHQDNQKQALELKFSKTMLPNASLVNLFTGMALQYFAYDISDAGKEQNRAGSAPS